MAENPNRASRRLDEIDPNFKTESAAGLTDVVFTDVRKEPFAVYGFCQDPEEPSFRRLPGALCEGISPHLAELSRHTAGGRVRFSTNSPYIAIRCRMPRVNLFPHMTLCGTAGFDLYETVDGQDHYRGTFLPPVTMPDGTYASYTIQMEGGYSAYLSVGSGNTLRSYTIHFPLYNEVESLEIGCQYGSYLDRGVSYREIPPMVFYGSSITQGGCASRPGNAYENILSSRLNIDHRNLGFSGSALGEPQIAAYLATLPMSLFVMDYDWNAPTPEYLAATHEPFFRILRAAQPACPILFLTKPSSDRSDDTQQRRSIIRRTYENARAAGDSRVYFLDGGCFFEGIYDNTCTVDHIHPNDAGFVRMATELEAYIQRILPSQEVIR